MHKERLIVKNFLSLKDIDVEISKFNIFIGEQASGKSILMKLVYFFRNTLRVQVLLYKATEDDVRRYIEGYFKQLFKISSINKSNSAFEIKYYYNDFSVSITSLDNKIIATPSDSLMQMYKKLATFLQNIDKQLLEKNTHPATIQSGIINMQLHDVLAKSELGKVTQSLFFPAGRTFLVGLHRNMFNMLNNINTDSKLPSIDSLLLLFGQDYQNSIEFFGSTTSDYVNALKKEKHLKWYDNQFSKILKGHYKYDSIGGFIAQDIGDVRPWDSSSGQQESLPIYLVLRNYLLGGQEPYHLYIEEPEAHLYPTAQKDILESLVYVTNITKSESLCITTHSPYIPMVLDNLIMANEVRDKKPGVDANLLVQFDSVRAYHISNGKAKDLRDKENCLIVADELDSISEQNATEFDRLLDLKYE